MPLKKNSHLIFGRHPVLDAIRAGKRLDKIYLQRGITGELEIELRQLCKEHEIPLQYVPKERLNRTIRGNHQGVIGYLALIDYYRLDDVVPLIWEKGETPLILLLDGVTDVRNFGAIARSAEACGVHALVVPKTGTALINADALKTSAGALTRLNVCRESSLVTAAEYLQSVGIPVYASQLKAEKYIFDVELSSPVAIVVGSEDEGVSKALLERVDGHFRIPQKGTTDSLNVSVAAGIMLYEVMRQRI